MKDVLLINQPRENALKAARDQTATILKILQQENPQAPQQTQAKNPNNSTIQQSEQSTPSETRSEPKKRKNGRRYYQQAST